MTHCCNSAYDLAVIGAGSAGFSAAITGADLGANVLFVGHGTIGGTCVNVGCVPSKTMIRAAEALHSAHSAARFPGLAGHAEVADWQRLVGAKDELVATLRRQKYVDLLPDYPGIEYREGRAQLNGGGLALDGEPIHAGKVIIATGAAAAVPDIPGVDAIPYLTSTTALELRRLPRSLLVIGGGYIGCELAQMFARAGTQVTLVTRRRILPEAEPEISGALSGYLSNEGIIFRTGLTCSRIVGSAAGIRLEIDENGKLSVLEAEQVLLATGRKPNTAALGLIEAGIALNAAGAVIVDEYMRTTRPSYYAAGDVTGRDQFVYMAAHGGKIAARNALDGDSSKYDNRAMPWVVFTDPQVAGVGLTERQARAGGLATKTSIVTLDQVPRALAARDTRGLIKLVADAETDRLLGGQILAPEGADSIQTLALALKHRMTTTALAETIFPYLTTVEGLKLAAQGFTKDVAKLSCCAG